MLARVLSVCLVAMWTPLGCHGYAEGPPTAANPGICTSMAPAHDSSPQTGTSPYEIVVPGTCYKEGLDIPVFVRVKAGETTYTYYEGLFVMARNTTVLTDNTGTFSKTDSELQTLSCYGKDMSAIGHNTAEHWGCKTFKWRATAGHRDPVIFHGVVTKNKEIYWMGLMSSQLTYSDTCTVDAAALTTECSAQASGSEGQHRVVSALTSMVIVGLLQFILP